jgi:hypothetical protein
MRVFHSYRVQNNMQNLVAFLYGRNEPANPNYKSKNKGSKK